MMSKHSFYAILTILTILVSSCRKNSTYDNIKSYIDNIKVIDTHSHQGMPWKKKHNLFDVGMYLHTDLISAGMPEYSAAMEEEHDPEKYWEHSKEYLRFCRTTSYYTQFIYNYNQLYGLEGKEINREKFLDYSAKMDNNFNNYKAWLDSGYKKLNIDLILSDRVWQPFDTNFDTAHFRYVFRIDELVLDATKTALEGKIINTGALNLLNREEYEINSLQSYLDFVDEVIRAVIDHGAVSFKIGLAYHRSIDFEKVDTQVVRSIFLQREISPDEEKILQDYIVYEIIRLAAQHHIPVQIHTGYLHGNGNYLDRGHPMKLLHLIHDHPDVKFMLFHGGYPWTGDYVILGKNYPNVFQDLVWLPQLSRTAAVRTLHEILDTVPYNKICWGSDVGYIDDAAGSLELGREVVATVLSERIEKGWMTEEIARDIARRIFRENAIEIFNLNR